MTEPVLAKPLTDVVSQDAEKLIEQSLQGQEMAYKTLLKLALSATTNADWQDFGGKPYLAGTGSKKIALRFNISLKFDRNALAEPAFQREEFIKDNGKKLYVYTISGRAELSNGRIFEEIGTCSTDDDFLGWEIEKDEHGKWIKDSAGNNQKIEVPIHEAIQDSKKKSVTNFQGRAVQGILGLGGLTWDDLEKYGITRTGKAKVEFKSSKAKDSTLPPAPSTKKGGPAWTFEPEPGKRLIFIKLGNHFDIGFVNLHKMKPAKKQGDFWANWDEALWAAIEQRLMIAEAPEEPGSQG